MLLNMFNDSDGTFVTQARRYVKCKFEGAPLDQPVENQTRFAELYFFYFYRFLEILGHLWAVMGRLGALFGVVAVLASFLGGFSMVF